MTTQIGNPFPLFLDRKGRPLVGDLYIGEGGLDPESNPVSVFFDTDLTQEAAQPLTVIGGRVTKQGYPALIYTAETQYSIRSRDADGAEVFYAAMANTNAEAYQPADADLTAIAALSTTPFGRALLTQASGSAVRSYIGVVPPLPAAGGVVTGAIKRQSAGAFPYFVDAAYADARIFVTANGAADPRVNVGDIWLEQVA